MPRDISLSDSKCWNGGHEWVKGFFARIWPDSHANFILQTIFRIYFSKEKGIFSRFIFHEKINFADNYKGK